MLMSMVMTRPHVSPVATVVCSRYALATGLRCRKALVTY
jgi:hypothetical protein